MQRLKITRCQCQSMHTPRLLSSPFQMDTDIRSLFALPFAHQLTTSLVRPAGSAPPPVEICISGGLVPSFAERLGGGWAFWDFHGWALSKRCAYPEDYLTAPYLQRMNHSNLPRFTLIPKQYPKTKARARSNHKAGTSLEHIRVWFKDQDDPVCPLLAFRDT